MHSQEMWSKNRFQTCFEKLVQSSGIFPRKQVEILWSIPSLARSWDVLFGVVPPLNPLEMAKFEQKQ